MEVLDINREEELEFKRRFVIADVFVPARFVVVRLELEGDFRLAPLAETWFVRLECMVADVLVFMRFVVGLFELEGDFRLDPLIDVD